MPMSGIEQPEFIQIDETLRLHRYTDDCAFALKWYQDEHTLWLVDGKTTPYTMEKVYQMYHYLQARGEVYFIEYNPCGDGFVPIGDVSFWREDMPIVIGEPGLQGRGIGKKVILALVDRAKYLGFSSLEVAEIYEHNVGSRKMFETCGFMPIEKTPNGWRYRRLL